MAIIMMFALVINCTKYKSYTHFDKKFNNLITIFIEHCYYLLKDVLHYVVILITHLNVK